MFKVGIVGFGYIGSVIGCCLADKGCDVLAVEVDERTVELTNKGETEHFEPQLYELLQRNVQADRIRATTDFARLVEVDYIVVTVGTPLDDNFKADLRYIQAAAGEIAKHLRKGQTVILKSTVVPHVTRDTFGKQLAEASGLQLGKDFFLAFSPERLAEGKAVAEFQSLPIVIGADDPASSAKVAEFWEKALGARTIQLANSVSAELTKLADNLWIDMNIAIANQIAKLCQALDADFDAVQKAANTLPKGQHHVNILQSSIGVGGSCLTKDPLFFAHLLEEAGFEGRIIRDGRDINDNMPRYTAKIIADWLEQKGVGRAKIAVLGAAFKNDTNDLRYTPVLPLIRELDRRGLSYQVTDPYVKQASAERVFGKELKLASLEEAIEGANVLCFACGHTVYRAMDLGALRNKVPSPCLFVDGRHSFSRQAVTAAGFDYVTI